MDGCVAFNTVGGMAVDEILGEAAFRVRRYCRSPLGLGPLVWVSTSNFCDDTAGGETSVCTSSLLSLH